MRRYSLILMLTMLVFGISAVQAQSDPEPTDPGSDGLRITEVLPSPGAQEIDGAAVVTVVFNRPVVPVGLTEQMETLPDPLIIDPAAAGSGEWINTAIYVFRPDPAWGGGATYTLTVDSDLTAVDGSALAEPFSWSFSTVAPAVTGVQPTMEGNNASGIRLDANLQMRFNMPVDRQSLEANFFVRPVDMPDDAVDGTFEWNETGDGFMFEPSEQLTIDTRYEAGFPADVVFDAAQVSTIPEYTWTISTVPLPAVISTEPIDSSGDVSPNRSIVLLFASPMNPASFEGLVTIEPQPIREPDLYFQDWNNGLQIAFPLEASTEYTITLEPGAEDLYGNQIDEPFSFSFTTAPYDPQAQLRVPGPVGFYNGAREATEVFLTHLNVSRLDLTLYRVPLATFAERALSEEYYDPTQDFGTESPDIELLRRWQIPSVAPQNVRRYELLDLGSTGATYDCLGALPSRLAVGATAIVVIEPDPLVARSAPVDGERVDLLYRDYTLPVVSGPVCSDSILWWEVRLRSGETAWVAEGAGGEYFLNARTPAETTPVVAQEEGPLPAGIYLLQASTPETNPDGVTPQRHFMVVGTANLVVKNAIDEVLVWATDVTTGEPIADAPLTVYGRGFNEVGRGTTDADGIARIAVPAITDLYVPRMVLLDGDSYFGVGLSHWSDGIDPWRFGVMASYYPQAYQTYLYTDRPIYRPEQPVYFRGVVRLKDDVNYMLPDVTELPVRIFDDEGEVIYERTLSLTEFGTFSDTLSLDTDAPLGSYRIEAELPTQHEWQREVATLFFNVAEYRLPEFQVEVTAQMSEVVRGETIIAEVESTYFFGGNVSDAVVEYNVITNPYTFEYTGPGPRYDFTDYNPDGGPGEFYGDTAGRVADGSGRTDEEGRFLIEVPADLEDASQSQRFTIEATVRDESGQTVAGRTEVIVHQGEVYIGARPENYVSSAGEETTLQFIAVDWDSDPVADQTIDVQIVERRWSNVQEEDPSGRTVWTWEVEEIPVDSANVTTATDGRTEYTFVPPYGGVFKAILTTQDDTGNMVRASTTFWVSSSEYVSWRQQNSNRIDLVTDADRYEIGDTAEVLITSPFQGEVEALITVERGNVLLAERVRMESNSYVYELPIEPEFAPNVYVTVMLVKGVDENNPVAAFRMGLVQLQVDTTRKEITIEATPDTEQAGPGDTVTYTLRTTNYAGEPIPAEVGVALTDLASLSIGEPNSAPILEVFYSAQGLAVRTATALTINTDQITQTILDTVKGGGGGFGEGGIFDIREDFVDTAYWQADLVTDENGEATFTVTLPDNLTTWRLDARAVTRGLDGETLVGQETFDLLSTKPLLIRPVTPRFFVVDDAVQLAAVVNNNTEFAQQVEVALEGVGVQFQGDAVQSVSIPAGGRVRVVWPVIVAAVEQVDLTFYARTENDEFTDASKPPLGQGDDQLLPVYRYIAPETVGTGGVLREAGSRTEAINLPENITGGELTIQVEPSLAAAALNALDYLQTYDFMHIEATISRMLPNVATLRALQQFNLDDEVLRQNVSTQVSIAVQRLAAQQKVNGGWGWYVQDQSNPLVTAYAVIGLVEARNTGFTVDPQMINRALEYLRTAFITPDTNTPTWQLDRQMFILYALAYAGEPDISRTVTLYELRENLSIYSQALLAETFGLIGENETRIDTLLSDINNAAILSANGAHWEESDRDFWNWNTDTRTTSLVLRALVRFRPESELIPNVVRWLMVARQADGWETTQETAWAVLVLTDWMVASDELDASYDWNVVVNEMALAEGNVIPDIVTTQETLVVSVEDMLRDQLNDLVFSRSAGPGNLYYTAYLRGLLPVPEIEPLNRGIIVQRRYTLLDDPDGGTVTEARVGDAVQVRLTIIAPNDLHYVVVEDPIPAGVEPINPNLVTEQQIGTRPGLDTNNPLSSGWGWWWFSNVEFRDEKVVLNATYLPAGTYEYVYTFRPGLEGTYNVIPSTGYEFYFPDVFGRGAGGTFTVLPADS
ncbi:MAG: Ig-like domain-containing protein [Chloroflexota bacterium]